MCFAAHQCLCYKTEAASQEWSRQQQFVQRAETKPRFMQSDGCVRNLCNLYEMPLISDCVGANRNDDYAGQSRHTEPGQLFHRWIRSVSKQLACADKPGGRE